jgi:2-polyprenyl-3-methyl-5-hydroxy-6-metoxy-1,4-benzoquinol methylase
MFKYPWQNIDANVDTTVTRLLKLVGAGKNVLEVGCATGYVSKVMKEQLNCTVTGIEISPDAAKEAEKYSKRVIVGNIEEMDLAGILGEERFDVITFGDVLEHLKNPDKVLTTVRPFLAEGGYVLASIPNVAHISIPLELLSGRFDYRPLGLLDDTHLRFFTKKSILSLFRNAGYEIILWDRVIVNPKDTEFQTDLDSYPYSLLSFFENGSDALTYQFIVKAIPCTPDRNFEDLRKEWENNVLQDLRRRLEEKGQQLEEKERQLEEKERQLEEKGKQLEAMRHSWTWKITAPLRWIHKNLRKEGK